MAAGQNHQPQLWKQGQSGNPSGRPKGLSRKIREMVNPEEIIAVLTEIIFDGQQKTHDRIEAIKELFDRGWGRPHQSLSLDADIRNDFLDMLTMTPEQRSVRLRELEAKRASAQVGMLGMPLIEVGRTEK